MKCGIVKFSTMTAPATVRHGQETGHGASNWLPSFWLGEQEELLAGVEQAMKIALSMQNSLNNRMAAVTADRRRVEVMVASGQIIPIS